MHNIDKSAFRRGEYVGYGGGVVWRIFKTGGIYQAIPKTGEYAYITESTLREVSQKLDVIDKAYAPKKNPRRKPAKRSARAPTAAEMKRAYANPRKRVRVAKVRKPKTLFGYTPARVAEMQRRAAPFEVMEADSKKRIAGFFDKATAIEYAKALVRKNKKQYAVKCP